MKERRSKRNYQGARGKIKKEQGGKKDEKGAVKIGEASKNGREQGEHSKMSKAAGSMDPPNRASLVTE